MKTASKIRIAMTVIWFSMMFIDWDIIWMCLFCIGCIDIYDDLEHPMKNERIM